MTTWSAKMGSARSLARSATLLTLILTAACETSLEADPAPSTAVQDPQILYSNVWSADAGVDLFSRGAELVRGIREAAEYSYFVGLNNSYPGYAEAVGGPAGRNNPKIDEVMARLEPRNSRQEPSTVFRHITAYSAADRTIKATVCEYKLFPELGRTDAPPNSDGFSLSDAIEVDLENNSNSPGLPGIADGSIDARDSRANRPPTWNIFGTWTVNTLRVVPAPSIPQGCMDWWHEQFPTFTQQADAHILSAPPGFQVPVQPVAIQYPEWIGPATPQ